LSASCKVPVFEIVTVCACPTISLRLHLLAVSSQWLHWLHAIAPTTRLVFHLWRYCPRRRLIARPPQAQHLVFGLPHRHLDFSCSTWPGSSSAYMRIQTMLFPRSLLLGTLTFVVKNNSPLRLGGLDSQLRWSSRRTLASQKIHH